MVTNRNIMQIVWLVIPGVGPGYRGAGPWPGVGVPQQRRASVADWLLSPGRDGGVN